MDEARPIPPGYLGALTEEQASALDEFKELVWSTLKAREDDDGEIYVTPLLDDEEEGSDGAGSPQEVKLSERQRRVFKDRRTMLRFLRQTAFDVHAAFEKYAKAARWRRSFHGIGVEGITEEHVQNELRAGKGYFYKYDRDGRLILYIHPRKHFPSESDPEEVRLHTVFQCERGADMLKLPMEQSCLVYDMTGVSYANFDYELMKFIINTVQEYYPGGMGRCLVVDAPWITWAAWKIIGPWMPENERAKVKFVSRAELTEYIAPENLIQALGGDDPFECKYIPKGERVGEYAAWKPYWEMEWVVRTGFHADGTPFEDPPPCGEAPT